MVAIAGVKRKKPDFLKTKFEIEYLTMALMCAGLLVIMVALPYTDAYNMTDYQGILFEKNEIYDSECSKIYG